MGYTLIDDAPPVKAAKFTLMPDDPSAPTPTQDNTSFGQHVLNSIVEPVLSMGSGMIAKPVSDITGLAATAREMVSPQGGDPEAFRQHVRDSLTYSPKSAEGKAVTEYNPLALVGKGLGYVGDKAGQLAGSEGSNPSFGRAVAEAVPSAAAIAGVKYLPDVVSSAKTAMRGGAEDLMQSALKPTIATLKNGDAATAINTMLDQGINVSKGGLEKIHGKIDLLNDEIKSSIANSPARIDLQKVAVPLQDKLAQFKMQVNPNADLNSIKNAWQEFQDHPLLNGKTDISVQLAQDLKQGTYQQLNKKYGQMGSADIEAQKAIARGLKEGIANQVPEISGLNAQESALFKTLSVAERRVLMESNKNPMGLALLASHPGTWAAFLADRSGAFKSVAARILNSAQENITNSSNIGVPAVALPSQAKNPRLNQLLQGKK